MELKKIMVHSNTKLSHLKLLHISIFSIKIHAMYI